MAKELTLSGYVGWEIEAQGVREFLQAAGGDDIVVRLSSPGGLVSVGLEVFNLIRNYAGHKVCVISGYAMSMGSYIPLAFDEIHVEDNAVYMIHNARGGVWGDHNDILNYGAVVKGLSGILARSYVKRTDSVGKPMSMNDVVAAMNAETFYFGSDIVDAGFADLLLEAGNSDDPDASLSVAKAAYADCMAKMATEHAAVKADLQRAQGMMALFESAPQPPVAPAATGESVKEVAPMAKKLNELLADNPAAKAELDELIVAARQEGKSAVEARVTAAKSYIGNASYPGKVQEVALKVIAGETSTDTLLAVVAAVDAVMETKKGEQAASTPEAGQETPAAPAPQATVDPGAVVADEAGLNAAIARANGKEV